MMARGKREENNPNRRPQNPRLTRFDTWSSDNPEMPQGNISASMADLIKQAAYDAEFNNIVKDEK